MLLVGAGTARAQCTVTSGKVPVFVDEFGDICDSVVTQAPGADGNNHIGIGTAPDNEATLSLAEFRNGRIAFVQIRNEGLFSGAGLQLVTPAAGSDWFLFGVETGAGQADGLVISNQGLRRLIIKASNGNVGLGTDNPSAKLHVIGDFIATGAKSAVVETASYGQRQLYAVESPENWFEDFGRSKLVNGRALIKVDPIFLETVNTKTGYHIFLTPKGDCQGLYVAKESPTQFEVREVQNGKATIAFDYRIVAKRKGYESVRLARLPAPEHASGSLSASPASSELAR